MDSVLKTIFSSNAPAPGGHYSQAVVHNGLVYVAGQLPITPAGAKLTGAPVEAQAEQALRNVAAILEAAGTGLDRVLQLTVYVADISEWATVNAVCAQMFGEHRPERAVVPVKELHFGFGLEIQVVAALDG